MATAKVTREIRFKTLKSFAKADVDNIQDVKPVTKVGSINEGQTVIILKSGGRRHTIEPEEEIRRAMKEAEEG